jgi:hypothetical protein
VARSDWVRTPVDAFVLARLEARGLTPSDPAPRAILIRRATYDLTGLPPTPGEVAAFLRDPAPDAYERLIDRLLASPRYGERWARHWLDLARYADSDGYEDDEDRPHAWRYRDYVIASLNEDRPYDRFVLEQLAGDELAPGEARALTATGFCRNGLWDAVVQRLGSPAQKVKARFEELDDIVSTAGSVFLGLTVGCARCHDHKYDPIPQREYYGLLSCFANAEKRDLPAGSPLERQRYRDALAAYRKRLAPLCAELVGREFTPPLARVAQSRRIAELRARLAALKAEVPREPLAQCLVDTASEPRLMHRLLRGDPRMPAEGVSPGVIAALEAPPASFLTPAKGAAGTGRRLALARWIASADNPLTARVMVNRLWQHHFARGLVETPSNFGKAGARPTHPELLDWLACEFVARGWSLKAMHRLMMTSATYRQRSDYDRAKAEADPEDLLLWRAPHRRLEAEAIRDSILQASGALNPQMYGPGVKPRIDPGIIAANYQPIHLSAPLWPVVECEGPEHWRRSVYVFIKRTVLVPLLEGFDLPPPAASCERRIPTTVATQSLQLMNGQFLQEQAERMADRIRAEAGDQPAAQIDLAYWLALGRPATGAERRRAIAFLRERGAAGGASAARADLCHVLLNCNEFLYLD